MLNLSRPGIEPISPSSAVGFLSIAPPGKSKTLLKNSLIVLLGPGAILCQQNSRGLEARQILDLNLVSTTHDNPLQCSCPDNPTNRLVHGVTKLDTTERLTHIHTALLIRCQMLGKLYNPSSSFFVYKMGITNLPKVGYCRELNVVYL